VAAPVTNLIPIDAHREPRTRVLSYSTTLELRKEKATESAATTVEDLQLFGGQTEPRQTARLSQSDLYPARHAFSREHITALRLLKIAIGRSRRALEAHRENDLMAADIEIQKLQALLPELFCCRALGDGFGTIINALICVFQNVDGNALNGNQVRMLESVFQRLRDKPFLSTVEADDAVELLESARFNPYPIELIEFLSSDQSVR
jgi:hypothetical protein